MAPFRPLITAIRWGTLAVGVTLAASRGVALQVDVVVWTTVLLAYATWRTSRPILYRTGELRSFFRVAGDVALNAIAVLATGCWDSPFVFSLITAVITAGFAEGFGFAIRIAVIATLSVAIPVELLKKPDDDTHTLATSVQWSTELLLVALVAGYGRRLFEEAEERDLVNLDRIGRLSEANNLLYSLYQLSQDLPASLDLGEVTDSTLGRLRALFDFNTAAIFVSDDATESWMALAVENVQFEAALSETELPGPLREAAGSDHPICVTELADREPPGGLSEAARSGLYASLRTRDHVVGLVALEHAEPAHFTSRDVELLEGLVESAALAIDNARWFSRLRRVGADEERTRIARDLHDSVAQSLSFIGFELDRITKRAEGMPIQGELRQLYQEVRTVVGELRETLYDVRTEVSEDRDVVATLASFLDRVKERSGLEVVFDHEATGRLPVRQERELWRIAQEAIINAERHAKGTQLRVRWRSDGSSAVLEVSDNGAGLPGGSRLRADAYGMQGMRERADAIEAALEVESAPAQGTTIRCRLNGRVSKR